LLKLRHEWHTTIYQFKPEGTLEEEDGLEINAQEKS